MLFAGLRLILSGFLLFQDREATQKPTNPAAENSHGISCNVGDVTSLEVGHPLINHLLQFKSLLVSSIVY